MVTAVGSPAGVNVLRSLTEAGRYSVIAADADARSAALYQYGTERVLLPLARDERTFVGAVSKAIAANRISVLISCVEEEIVVLAKYRRKLEKLGVRIPVPSETVVRRACDKRLLAQVAAENTVSSPRSCWLSKGENSRNWRKVLDGFARECVFPWIVKPPIGHGMKGIVRVENLDSARTAVEGLELNAVIQEFIPGKLGSMHLVGLLYDFEGRMIRSFASRSIKTLYPTGGPATGGVSLHLPELVAETERCIRRVGEWIGPVCAEWMLDPRDGQFKLIEINPRLWGYGSLATASGTNFPATLVDMALGKAVGADPGYQAGVVMLRSTHDVTVPGCPFELPPSK